MVELMIIADDFTGALDSGVHFAERGIRTRVIVSMEDDRSWEEGLKSGETTVLVVDAETRHASPEQAGRKVHAIVSDGKKAGIPYIYKKTDSALRGNIGSELEAALRASGEPVLSFVPALPRMNRITKGGKHYIDGVPVSRSVFGKDPFEPVARDDIEEIIGLQSKVPVTIAEDPEQLSGIESGIVVYDARSEADIERIGAKLAASGQSRLLAGCAGFASILPTLLGLERREPEAAALENRLFVICGSVNPITKKQLDRGEQAGFPQILHETGGKAGPGILEIGRRRTAGTADNGGRKRQGLRHPGHQRPGGNAGHPGVRRKARHGHRGSAPENPGNPGNHFKTNAGSGA